jgi:hypothetical protein
MNAVSALLYLAARIGDGFFEAAANAVSYLAHVLVLP